MSELKTLTLESVAFAADLLIEASPIEETTTLEVKTLLRYLGYEAIQADVSVMMEAVESLSATLTHTVVTDSNTGNTFKAYYHEEDEEVQEALEEILVTVFGFRQ